MSDAYLYSLRERYGLSRPQLTQGLECNAHPSVEREEGILQHTPGQPFGDDSQHCEQESEVTACPEKGAVAFLLLPPATTLSESSSGTMLLSKEDMAVCDPFLPPPFVGKDRLVGRDRILHDLGQHLLTNRRVALHGLPGVGKTSLAVVLAHTAEIRHHFRDGILWIGLGVHVHILAELRRWGALLGVSLPETDGPALQSTWLQTLREALKARELLIVIDDAWQEDIVHALEIGGPGCGYILTTRCRPLASHFAGEYAFLIPELEDATGVQILARFAPELLEQELDTLRALVRAVGGLPLALSLMSKHLGSQALAHQPRRLQAALTYLQNTNQRLHLQIPQRPSERSSALRERKDVSLKSVISLSYIHLPDAAQRALRSFSVFPVKPKLLSRQAVLAITDVSLEMLQVLCDAGLLEQANANDYFIHPLIVDYARTFGTEPGTYIRLVMYGIAFVEAHILDIAVLEKESAIIIAALQCAWERRWYTELIRGVRLFVPVLLRRGQYRLAEQLLQYMASALLVKGDERDKILLREQLSALAHAQGNYAQSHRYAEEGLALADRVADQEKIITLLTRLGIVAQEQGEYVQAEILYQRALTRARTHGMTEPIIILLKNLGVLAKKRGSYAQAQKHYQEALTLATFLGQNDLISLLLMNLGVVATEQGMYAQSLAYYQKGLELARKASSQEQICVLLSNLGVVADAQGDYVQAEHYLCEGLMLAREMGHCERISLLLLNLGVIKGRQGDDLYAEKLYREGLALAQKIGHRERICLFLLNLGDVVMEQQGREAEALASYQEGLLLAQGLGQQTYISDLHLRLGVLATRQGEMQRAEGYLEEGLLLAYQLGHPQLICQGLAAWGEHHLLQRHLQGAEQVFQEMLVQAPIGYQTLKAHAQYGLARIAAIRGQFQQAKALGQECWATFETLGHRKRSIVQAFLNSLLLDSICN